ncbi:MAG: methylated-DNA--[protein]-cysteine S-methyltransferase [Anaerolineae bacterium]|nr:methylated-DNA--[protein]-cysteine S-methyltransferase [Anaerolineae bacterium]MDW8069871.1 methylated-DNA--[protein]-cysteine S-methyltransferase [Anaerolineae bacterium]
MRVHYACLPCPLEWLLLAATERGVCALKLGDTAAELEAQLRTEFALAALACGAIALSDYITPVLAYLEGRRAPPALPLDVRATPFQREVWQALQRIPCGQTRTYGQVAAALGRPNAARAVARACAANPVALLIPCHRVVREDGTLGGYRWGVGRKAALLRYEAEWCKRGTIL